MSTILQTRRLTKEFPGVVALDGFDFNLKKGEVHAIVGENGAGKSTFIKLLAGIYRPTSGDISINGTNVSFNNPKEASGYFGVVYQENDIIPHFTGYQNLTLGEEISAGGYLKNREMISKVNDLLGQYNFSLDLNMPVREMSTAQQEMLSILRILYLKTPVIIFDEPTAQLGLYECEILFKLIDKLKKEDKAIIYISHRLEEVLDISDRISILRNGRKVATVENADIDEKQLIRYMIDKDIDVQYPKIEIKIKEEVIKVQNYSNSKYKFNNINLNIKAGEIVGFAGLVGSGRTELAKSIFFDYKKDTVHIAVSKGNKKDIDIAFIPEKRREEGLLVDFSVAENISLPHLKKLNKFGYLLKNEVREYIESIITKLSVKCASINQPARTLSGGNQQKISIGKWMGEDCPLWIFDEPTHGIDVDAKSEIYNIIGNIAAAGGAIWIINSELHELTEVADRIYVMKDFNIINEFHVPFDKEEILNNMMGVD